MKILWATDLHFNHVTAEAWDQWVEAIKRQKPNGVLITGDIAESGDIVSQLNRVSDACDVPIYFVLGNHDFYRGSIARTRQDVICAVRSNSRLHYMTDVSEICFYTDVFLLGDDGWGDATVGDYENSPIRLNDFSLIQEFRDLDPEHWKQHLQLLGRQSAERLETKLDSLPTTARSVLVITHVPPFRESCWYEGKTTDDHWAPFFVGGEVGAALLRHSQSRPDCQFTVVCGHTHHRGVARIANNLTVYTGAAEYGRPDIESTLQVTENGWTLLPREDR